MTPDLRAQRARTVSARSAKRPCVRGIRICKRTVPRTVIRARSNQTQAAV